MSASKKSLEELVSPDYWNDRYQAAKKERPSDEADRNEAEKKDDYEWFQTFESLKPWLLQNLDAPSDNGPRILHLGNGTSVSHINQTSAVHI
jgi:hypothetical protein